MNRLRSLTEQGQAIWLDYIRRDILEDGTLAALVERDGLTGVTSNPAIFQQAIGESELYDEDLRTQVAASPEAGAVELYERLAVTDIRLAADLLRPVYERTAGADGFVSLEVSPHLARDTEGTVAEARRLWELVARPNLMIKVPATEEGIPAIARLLADSIHVNVTLMFSLADYEAVAAAYLQGLEVAADPAAVASVASFFVSRVDSKVDAALRALGSPEALALLGRSGVANSRLAYSRFQEVFGGARFAALRERGARPQRVLWASTSTKDPAYRDVLYVEELIGPETVNTLPPATLEAFRDHGEARRTVDRDVDGARELLGRLAELGVDFDAITSELQREGVEKFAEPFDRLLATLEGKRAVLTDDVGAATRG